MAVKTLLKYGNRLLKSAKDAVRKKKVDKGTHAHLKKGRKVSETIESLGRGGGGMRHAKSLKNQKVTPRVKSKDSLKAKHDKMKKESNSAVYNKTWSERPPSGRWLRSKKGPKGEFLGNVKDSSSFQAPKYGKPGSGSSYYGKHKNKSTTD